MTRHHNHDTLTQDSINVLIEHGLAEGLPRIAEMLLNAAMIIERSAHLGAGPFERSDERTGYANGLKGRTFHSSLGALNLRVPQTRACEEPYKPSMLESGSRVDRALKAAVAEMYLQGVSTRRVTKVMEQLCGLEVSSTQVSRLTAELSEAEPHWRRFLLSLKERGIGIPDSLTSDAHEGLRAALKAVFNASPWQRCQYHLQQNAQAYVPKVDMRETVAADIRTVFNADSLPLAEERLRAIVKKYAKSAPQLSASMETALPEGLTVFGLPEYKRKRLRTSNMSETLNTQIKRRTKKLICKNNNMKIRFRIV